MATIQETKSTRLVDRLSGDKPAGGQEMTIRNRELDNFDAFFEANWPRILSLVDRLVGDADEAEDLALEAFVKLYEARERLGPGDNPGGWLYRAAMNLGLNALRSRYRRRWYEVLAGRGDLEQNTGSSPAALAEAAEQRRQVQRVLAEIKPRSSQLLVLRAAGLSYQELAETLQVGVSSIGPLLNRAEQEFEKKYRSLYGNQE